MSTKELHQGLILFRRMHKDTIIQILACGSIMFSFGLLFESGFEIANDFYYLYLGINLLLLFLLSITIFFRQSLLELNKFKYTYLSGYKFPNILVIICTKWLLVIFTGIILSFFAHLIYNYLSPNLINLNNDFFENTIIYFFVASVITIGIGASCLKFVYENR